MLDAAFVHRRRTANVGDLACTPGAYFDFGNQQMFDFEDDIPDCKLAVLGGGQVFQQCVDAAIFQAPRAEKRVIWGVGISPKDIASIGFDLLEANSALVSTRNRGIDGCEYVPCVSAMSPLFDAPPEPIHDVVLFSHARKSENLVRVEGIPERSNHDGTMADAIAFLASGDTVVTNSYHGTYWAMCLGRRVICVPFSRKFQFFRENPVMARPDSWPEQIKHAERRNGVLEDAQTLNKQFFEKVRNLW